jgi:hypothetical protein
VLHEDDLQHASFRDPAGYVFSEDGVVKRAIAHFGRADYERLMESGLYDTLVADSLLVPHSEEPHPRSDASIYKTIVPKPISFISYPYEWCFDALKDAALLTLDIQKRALGFDMSLKDASFFNVQFAGARPVFIDTLSFERAEPRPWVAYRQFCQHFLAPLLLMASVRPDFNRFLESDLDGFDLAFTNSLLPYSFRFRPGTLLHIGLHARSQARHESRTIPAARPRMERKALIALLGATLAGLL